MEEKLLKGGLVSIVTVWSHFAGNITPMFILLIIFQILDYLTGMIVAKFYPSSQEDGWSSKIATRGFIKKMGYFALVGVAWGTDLLIIETLNLEGLAMGIKPFFGIFAVCYLILTEAISILENLHKMGVDLPFFTEALKVVREKISQARRDKQ